VGGSKKVCVFCEVLSVGPKEFVLFCEVLCVGPKQCVWAVRFCGWVRRSVCIL